MLLLIDNYDSFTFNLARYFSELGEEVEVIRNDQISCQQIADMAPEYLVFSPGPCTPNEAGITLGAIEQFAGKIPILGVCLGHQAIGQVFGGKVIRAKHIMHGKTSMLEHQSQGLFENVPNPFQATRYHSLILESQSLPDELIPTAWCNQFSEPELMALRHRSLPVYGVQFHPESLLTPNGHTILQNFLNQRKNS